MSKALYLDMDGTIANLYQERNWLERLQTHSSGLFRNLKPIYDSKVLSDILEKLMDDDWRIEVITWTPKDTTDEYHELVASEKIAWMQEHLPIVDTIHIQRYGTPKQKAIKPAKVQVLADDNAEIRELWETPKRRKSIDATQNLIVELERLLGNR